MLGAHLLVYLFLRGGPTCIGISLYRNWNNKFSERVYIIWNIVRNNSASYEIIVPRTVMLSSAMAGLLFRRNYRSDVRREHMSERSSGPFDLDNRSRLNLIE
jgi:hypothetical protein